MTSPVPWLSDEKYSALGVGERALIWASTQDKVEEHPRGSNRGKEVEAYQRAAGAGPGDPWCAAFVTWCLLKAGASRKDLPDNPAAVAEWVSWARKRKWKAQLPARGNLFYLLHSDGKGHIGFCCGDDPAGFATIEGNTNTDGSREGYAVCRRKRSTLNVHGFIDLAGLK